MSAPHVLLVAALVVLPGCGGSGQPRPPGGDGDGDTDADADADAGDGCPAGRERSWGRCIDIDDCRSNPCGSGAGFECTDTGPSAWSCGTCITLL